MRLTIDHQTTYRFSAQQARLVQMLRLTPQNTHDQTVVQWRIDVDRDARLRDRRDGWGNAVTMLYVEGPLDTITIAVTGEVLTSHSDGVIRGVEEPLAPELFRRTTPATAADATIAEWARNVAAGDDPLTVMHRLNGDLHARFPVDHARRDVWLDAADAWKEASATPRDLAQMLIAGARTLAIPARYVSGYWRDGGAEQPTPHGWAEAHVAGLGWVGFDPCTGLSPQDDHVRIAVALDAAGAAPIAGSRLGEGEEQLDVELRVSEA